VDSFLRRIFTRQQFRPVTSPTDELESSHTVELGEFSQKKQGMSVSDEQAVELEGFPMTLMKETTDQEGLEEDKELIQGDKQREDPDSEELIVQE